MHNLGKNVSRQSAEGRGHIDKNEKSRNIIPALIAKIKNQFAVYPLPSAFCPLEPKPNPHLHRPVIRFELTVLIEPAQPMDITGIDRKAIIESIARSTC